MRSCRRCTEDAWRWVKRHTAGKGKRKGPSFYEAAGKRSGIPAIMTAPDYSPLSLRPLRDIVWLVHEAPPALSSILWTPDDVGDNANSAVFARVVAMGPGRILKTPPMSLGDMVHGPDAEGDTIGDPMDPTLRYDGKVWRVIPRMKVGDRVLVGRLEGHDLEVMGRRVRVVIEEAIHAIAEHNALAD
jgi:hypothetical protein